MESRAFLCLSGMLLISSITDPASSLFQCQPSTDQSGLVYTPNIPDFYFDDKNAANFRSGGGANLTTSRKGDTYIFTIPAESAERNCTGNVVATQYCYETRDNQIDSNEITVFNFLHMNRSGLVFTVTGSFTEETSPQNRFCTNSMGMKQICCDTATLDMMDQFQLPTTSYTFAVMVINNDALPLAFAASATDQYRHEQLTLRNSALSPGITITLSQNDVVTDKSLLLLRFILELATSTSEVATELGISTAPKPEESGSTHQEPLASSVSSSSSDVIGGTTDQETPTSSVSSSSSGVIGGTTDQETPTSSVSSSLSGVIGGAIGGLVGAVLFVTAAVVMVVGLVVACRRKKYSVNQKTLGITMGEPSTHSMADQGEHYTQQEAISYSYAVVGANSLDSGSVAEKEEKKTYVVPAGNVAGLLRQIRAKVLSRNAMSLGSQLGSGQFGTVYKGVWVSPNGEVEVAVKTLNERSGEEDRVKFLQEAAIMGQFKHPNVVEMYGVVTQGEPVLIALELLPKGDLRKYLVGLRSADGTASVDDHTLLSYCRQVANGMAYLSSKAFVHRDLAARNILLSDDDICKIADFGMSRDLMDENYYISHGGKVPIKWTAPEALHYKKYSTASDVWSYGVLMYEIWSVGHKPFEKSSNTRALELIDAGHRLAPPPGCPRALYGTMISCWNPDTRGRPSFIELTRQLSLPDTKLLKWSEEDRSVHPEAAHLGADLLCGEGLYKELQVKYKFGTDYMNI